MFAYLVQASFCSTKKKSVFTALSATVSAFPFFTATNPSHTATRIKFSYKCPYSATHENSLLATK